MLQLTILEVHATKYSLSCFDVLYALDKMRKDVTNFCTEGDKKIETSLYGKVKLLKNFHKLINISEKQFLRKNGKSRS